MESRHLRVTDDLLLITQELHPRSPLNAISGASLSSLLQAVAKTFRATRRSNAESRTHPNRKTPASCRSD